MLYEHHREFEGGCILGEHGTNDGCEAAERDGTQSWIIDTCHPLPHATARTCEFNVEYTVCDGDAEIARGDVEEGEGDAWKG